MKPPAHPPGPTRPGLAPGPSTGRRRGAGLEHQHRPGGLVCGYANSAQLRYRTGGKCPPPALPALFDVATPPPNRRRRRQAGASWAKCPAPTTPEPLSLQLRNAQGRLLLRSRARLSRPLPPPCKRVFTTPRHPASTPGRTRKRCLAATGRPSGRRAEARWRTASSLVAVLLLMLPVLLWLIHWIARRELHSLRWLQAQIRAAQRRPFTAAGPDRPATRVAPSRGRV